MAARPIFLPNLKGSEFVKTLYVEFQWHPGFSKTQKHRNIEALHDSAAEKGISPVLEISTKSLEKLGKRLSAFNLRIEYPGLGAIPLECAFQGSKVFAHGGPFTDLYTATPLNAKRDPRLKTSGPLVSFFFNDEKWCLEPKTSFYDWLYLQALLPLQDLHEELTTYKGFTDIEYNPKKSFNCQAQSCALFVSLKLRGLLDEALLNPRSYRKIIARSDTKEVQSVQLGLFD